MIYWIDEYKVDGSRRYATHAPSNLTDDETLCGRSIVRGDWLRSELEDVVSCKYCSKSIESMKKNKDVDLSSKLKLLYPKISEDQIKLCHLLNKGCNARAIGRELFVSSHAVYKRVRALKGKVQLKNQTVKSWIESISY